VRSATATGTAALSHQSCVRSSPLKCLRQGRLVLSVFPKGTEFIVFGWYNQYPCPVIQQCLRESLELTVVTVTLEEACNSNTKFHRPPRRCVRSVPGPWASVLASFRASNGSFAACGAGFLRQFVFRRLASRSQPRGCLESSQRARWVRTLSNRGQFVMPNKKGRSVSAKAHSRKNDYKSAVKKHACALPPRPPHLRYVFSST
jgi:hypothetical protein